MPIIYSTKQLRERDKLDYYPTPIELARAALNTFREIHPKEKKAILDPGAGDGVWGRAAKEVYPNADLCGVEIDITKAVPGPPPREYAIWDTRNFLMIDDMNPIFDLVIGNPPYKFAEEFLDKSYSLLANGGHILFLLRLSFLESKGRYEKYFSGEMRPKHVYISTRRVSFTGDRKTDSTAYAVYLWEKGYTLPATLLDWISWTYDTSENN